MSIVVAMVIDDLLRRHGPILLRREHPGAERTLARAVGCGSLVSVLPGVYLPAGLAQDPRWRIAALLRWSPDAVVTGAAAAHFTFWPELGIDSIEVAARADPRSKGFRFSRRQIPTDLIAELDGARFTSPALTTLDLIDTHGADVVDGALRSRRVTLGELWRVLRGTRWRAGNCQRRTMLLDSRGEPWSAAERLAHRILRAAGITGWLGNYRVTVRNGHTYFLDIAFPGLKLAIEIDGRFHQTDLRQFETDRWRQNDLVVDGWMVLRFTYRMLVEDPDGVIAIIRRAMRRCAA